MGITKEDYIEYDGNYTGFIKRRKMMRGRGGNKKCSLEDEIKEGKGIDGIPMETWKYAEVIVKGGLN